MSAKVTGNRGRNGNRADDALSPVIGEMLMIVLALLLVSLFSLSLTGLLPEDRDCSIDVLHNETGNTIMLWHKGGDYIETSKLKVVIIQGAETTTVQSGDAGFSLTDASGSTESSVFNLGDRIEIDTNLLDSPIELSKGDTIRLVSPRNVIFSGTANL